MNKEKFYSIVYSSDVSTAWILTYVIHFNQPSVLEFLENVRSGLVNDMTDESVIECVAEAVRACINA
jgi:hypothetical protein